MGMIDKDHAEKILNDILPGFNFRDDVIPLSESNSILPFKIKNEVYGIWSVNHIKHYLLIFLKEKVPNSIISQEINDIDFIIINNENDDINPVELQRTIVGGNKGGFQNSQLEKSIRKQIDDNIKSYGKCWLFFDSEYFRYLNNGKFNKTVNLDMNWCIDYMKENKLKVFTIRYDGLVTELFVKDFEFLEQINSDDEIILNINKLKIYRNVLKGYRYSQIEIDNYYEERDKLIFENKDKESIRDLLSKSENVRNVLHAKIINALTTLPGINKVLNMEMVERRRLFEAGYLEIFELVNSYSNKSTMKFVDKFDICQYFPGYVRNKEIWNKYKNCNLLSDQLNALCNGKYKNVKEIGDLFEV